jgi:hypothetical protein
MGASLTAAPPAISSSGAWPVRACSRACWRSMAPAMACAPPLIRASLVLVGKSTTSPVGTFSPAVPISSALQHQAEAGQDQPPRKRPSASSASTVTAVPTITTSAGRGVPAASTRARPDQRHPAVGTQAVGWS